MKRLFVVIVALLCFANFAFAESWRVFDNAGLFSTEEIAVIEQSISDFQRSTNMDFVVLTTDDYLGENNQQAITDSFYDSGNFGFGRQASGMLYYIDMNQRKPYVSTCGEMIFEFFGDKLINAHNACHPFLANGEYKNAVLQMIEKATDACKKGAE